MFFGWFARRPAGAHAPRQDAGARRSQLFLQDLRDGVIDLGGGEYRGVLEVTPRNLDLASPEERDEMVAVFRAFLNGLTFPFQILVRIERLDAEDYLARLAERIGAETSAGLRALALAQLGFVRDLAASRVLLRRRFYVVVPFSLSAARERESPAWFGIPGRASPASQASTFAHRLLARRQSQVIRDLEAVGLRARSLGTDAVLALYHAILCPTQARLQPLRQSVAAATAPVVQGSRPPRADAREVA